MISIQANSTTWRTIMKLTTVILCLSLAFGSILSAGPGDGGPKDREPGDGVCLPWIDTKLCSTGGGGAPPAATDLESCQTVCNYIRNNQCTADATSCRNAWLRCNDKCVAKWPNR